jgi:antibiotic biosynthesis monooxygenase (ABM) superfamily enzyme
MTLAAWLAAFLTVLMISTVFRRELAALPRVVRALVLSGVLVALMVNLVMPIVSVAIQRWLPGVHRPAGVSRAPAPPDAGPPPTRRGNDVVRPGQPRQR